MVEGEEGSGKSRLVDEFLRSLGEQDPQTLFLRARAFEAERDRPWVLARHLLAPLAAAPGLAAAPASALRALAALVPDVIARFPSLPATEPDDIAEAVTRVLAEVAAEVPVVMAVDDMDLADANSSELIETLCRRPVPGMLLLATFRTGTLPSLVDLARRSPDAAALSHLRLGPLTAAQVGQLLASMGEFDPAGREALARQLHAESGGNPLAVVEFVTGLAQDGGIAPGPVGRWTVRASHDSALPLPSSLQDAIGARLRRMPPDAIRVLRAAAVLGRESELDLLLSVSSLDARRLEDAIGELVEHRLLRLVSNTPARLEFGHELTRRLVYEGTPPLERQALHRRAYRALRHAEADAARESALAYHRVRAGRWRAVSRQGLVAAASLTVVIGIVAASLVAHPRRHPDARRIAVMPFVAAGDSAAGELAALMPQLVDVALMGAPGIEVEELTGDSAPLSASDEARRLGRHLRLQGTVGVKGSRVEIRASLRDAQHPDQIISTAEGEGALADLPAVAGDLIRALLPDLPTLRLSRFRLSAAHTTSLPALHSYLLGELDARRLEMEAAAHAFWQAAQADPDFAAAWHELARVNDWYALGNRAQILEDSAVRHMDGLTPRSRLNLEGWQLFASGQPDDAERRFESVLDFAPGTPEASIGMAETLLHFNWARGRDVDESQPYWEAARDADPDDWRPHVHLWQQAARQGRVSDAAVELRRLIALEGEGEAARSFRIVLAGLEADSVAVMRQLDAATDISAWELTDLTEELGATVGRPDLAEATATRLAFPTRNPELRAFGHELLAHLALAKGQWRRALAQLDSAEQLEPVSAGTERALFWSTPFLPPGLNPDSGRRAARLRLAGAPLHRVRRTFDFWFDFDRTREPLLRKYLDHLLAAQLGEATSPGLPISGLAEWSDSLARVQPFLERSAAAWSAAGAGDSADAITLLLGSWNGTRAVEPNLSVFFARPWDRWLMAQALAQSGRQQEALRWYGGLGVVSLADYAYTAPAALERARLLERLGRPEEARWEYRRFVSLWAAADPEFQPEVEMARERLKAES